MTKWISILLVLGLLFLGCDQKNKTEEKVLNVYNWNSYIAPNTLADFEKEFGIKVNYDNFDSNEILLSKINGVHSYDVIFPSDYMVATMIKQELLEPLNHNNLSNYKNLEARFSNLPYDPNNKYSIPYLWGTNGIAVNTKIVTEPVETWDILWDERYKGKITMINDLRASFYPALKRLGYSVNTTKIEELEAAKKLLIEQKPLVKAYTSETPQDMLKAGDLAVALAYSGDAYQVRKENPDIHYVIPKGGANLFVDAMCIPKKAPHKKNAEFFINYLLRPDVSANITNHTFYGNPNKEAKKYINPLILNDAGIYPPEDVMDQCEFFGYLGDHMKIYRNFWSEIKTE